MGDTNMYHSGGTINPGLTLQDTDLSNFFDNMTPSGMTPLGGSASWGNEYLNNHFEMPNSFPFPQQNNASFGGPAQNINSFTMDPANMMAFPAQPNPFPLQTAIRNAMMDLSNSNYNMQQAPTPQVKQEETNNIDADPESPAKKPRKQRKKRSKQLSEAEQNEKRQRFLDRNKVAAHKCRQRKKEWTDSLQDRASYLSSRGQLYRAEVDSLALELTHVRDMVNLLHQEGHVRHCKTGQFADLEKKWQTFLGEMEETGEKDPFDTKCRAQYNRDVEAGITGKGKGPLPSPAEVKTILEEQQDGLFIQAEKTQARASEAQRMQHNWELSNPGVQPPPRMAPIEMNRNKSKNSQDGPEYHAQQVAFPAAPNAMSRTISGNSIYGPQFDIPQQPAVHPATMSRQNSGHQYPIAMSPHPMSRTNSGQNHQGPQPQMQDGPFKTPIMSRTNSGRSLYDQSPTTQSLSHIHRHVRHGSMQAQPMSRDNSGQSLQSNLSRGMLDGKMSENNDSGISVGTPVDSPKALGTITPRQPTPGMGLDGGVDLGNGQNYYGPMMPNQRLAGGGAWGVHPGSMSVLQALGLDVNGRGPSDLTNPPDFFNRNMW